MHSKSGPGGTLYRYGLRELAQRQAVLLRKDKSSSRAIKSYKAKVVMTAGCISINFGIRKQPLMKFSMTVVGVLLMRLLLDIILVF